jgi:hypothetical protein
METIQKIHAGSKRLFHNFINGRNAAEINYWIPFEVDPSLTEFSHKGFTGLYFPKPPFEFQVARAFHRTLAKSGSSYITFLNGLYRQATSYDAKQRFLVNLGDECKKKEADLGVYKSLAEDTYVRYSTIKENVEIEFRRLKDLAQTMEAIYTLKDVVGNKTKLIEIAMM